MNENGVRYCFANWRGQEKKKRERRKIDFNNDDDSKVYL